MERHVHHKILNLSEFQKWAVMYSKEWGMTQKHCCTWKFTKLCSGEGYQHSTYFPRLSSLRTSNKWTNYTFVYKLYAKNELPEVKTVLFLYMILNKAGSKNFKGNLRYIYHKYGNIFLWTQYIVPGEPIQIPQGK